MLPEVYALRYGTFDQTEDWLVEGGSPERTVPLALYAFLVRSMRRTVLVDTGFLGARPGVREHEPVATALERLDLSPAHVNDVVITHGHWDHLGGLRDFLHARVWISRDEVAAMQAAVTAEHPEKDGYRWEDLQVVALAPRLQLVGRRRQVDPSVRLAVVSGHTPGMLAVTVLGEGLPRIMLAGDNAWLYRNLEGHPLPARSRRGGHDALRRIRGLAGDAPLVPGHDPDLARRYPEAAPGVLRLYP